MENTHYWYVFNYSVPGLFMFRDDNPVDDNQEEILLSHGFRPSECAWMITEEPLEIEEI